MAVLLDEKRPLNATIEKRRLGEDDYLVQRVLEINVGGNLYHLPRHMLRVIGVISHLYGFTTEDLKPGVQQFRPFMSLDSDGRLYVDDFGESFGMLLSFIRTGSVSRTVLDRNMGVAAFMNLIIVYDVQVEPKMCRFCHGVYDGKRKDDLRCVRHSGRLEFSMRRLVWTCCGCDSRSSSTGCLVSKHSDERTWEDIVTKEQEFIYTRHPQRKALRAR